MLIQPFKAQQEAQEIATKEEIKHQEEKLKKLEPIIIDGIEVVQIAAGISADVSSSLHRMRQIAEQVASGTLSKEDCDILQVESEQYQEQIDHVVTCADMDRVKTHVSDGNLVLQVGESKDQSISIPFREMTCTALGVDASKVNLSTPEQAADSMLHIDSALGLLGEQYKTLDAVLNRLEHVKEILK